MARFERKPIAELSYEEAFAELEEIVSALELGEQTLDDALSLFERGQGLTKHCSQLLAKAELKVQELNGEAIEPFQEGE